MDVPEPWLEAPVIAEEQRTAAVLNHEWCLGERLLPRKTTKERATNATHDNEVIRALITLMSLNEPGITCEKTKALDLQDIPVMAACNLDAMLWQVQALNTQAIIPDLTPLLTRLRYQYHTTWVKGVPISHQQEVQVHIYHNKRNHISASPWDKQRQHAASGENAARDRTHRAATITYHPWLAPYGGTN